MEDFMEDCCVEFEEADEEYEYDAPRFCDFTRPEFDHEIEEAERWFEVSGCYPPSPFIVKLNLEKILSVEAVPNTPKAKHSNKTKPINGSSDAHGKIEVSKLKQNAKGKSYLMQDKSKAKPKSDDKFFQAKSSTLMKPTASHLAKQNNAHDKHSGHICTRFRKTSPSLDKKGLQSPNGFCSLASKRQKLEIGYLRKVAHLKHQFSPMHKSKKVTVPREPELETLLRARRSKSSSASSETEQQQEKCCNFKALPLNRKIFKPPPISQPKKSTSQLPQFQLFRLKTMERANHHASAKIYPSARDMDVIQDARQKATNTTESTLSTDDMPLESPPIEQFSELSLGSDIESKRASQSDRHASAKGFKKDAHNSFQSKFWRGHAKFNQCGGLMRVREAEQWSNMRRRLGIS